MESWSYISEGRGYFVSEERGFPSDAHARSRTSLAGWEAKGPLNIENNASAFNYQESEGAECSELGFLEIMSKLFPSDSCVKLLDGETGADSSTRIDSATCLNTSTSSLGEDKIGSRLSSFLLEFNSQEPSLIDLNPGSLADSGDTKKRKAFRKRSLLPQIASTMSVKGTGSTNLCSQTFMCQVHGCNKDLSASKDYHKRHKVCDAHSKSTKVIVDGIEQRFCQQCSRFHLLAEFDDGKRSCRKRLAGHNERRRKPQLNVYSLKEDKLLRSYQGTTGLFGTLAEKISSFVFPNMSADRVFCSDESADFPKRIKFEEAAFCSSQHVTSLRNAHLPPKCSNQYEGTQCPVWIPPPVNEDFISMTSAIPESSPPLTSGNALSLLSAQSRALSVDSAGIPVATTSALHDLRYAGSLSSDSRFCANPSKDTAPNEFSSFRGNLMESGSAVAFGVGLEEACQGSDSNVSGRCSPNNGPHTVGLLKLSSHLQRVEQQRHLLQVKREIGESCRPPVMQLQ